MKAKLVALVLAAGLGVTGIAMTAQAAVRSSDQCPNGHTWNYKSTKTSYEEYSNFNHKRVIEAPKECKVCHSQGSDIEVIFEGHTLVLKPDRNEWICVHCGYTE